MNIHEIHEEALIVRRKNAQTVERQSRRRRRRSTGNLILQLVTAGALMAIIWLSANMQYSLAEVAAFCGCLVWIMLFLFANRK